MRSLLLFLFIMTFAAFTARAQSIQLTVNCTDGGLATSPYTLNVIGTTTDAGKTRNTFISNAALPPQTFGETMIIRWNLTTQRWEIRADDAYPNPNGDFLLFYSTFASAPNPPATSVGNWTRAGDGLAFCTGVPTLAGSTQITLPVKLLSFEAAARNDGTVSLDWITTTEEDNAFFEIQRSTGTDDFEIIGRVEGTGSSSLTTKYQFVDPAPALGLNLYRIRQVDFSGAFEFFPTRPVTITVRANAFTLYPNPVVSGQLTLAYRRALTGGETFTIKDLQGRVLLQGRIDATNQRINTGSLQKGIYLLATNQGDVARFMIQ